jgi:hypothetical protein
MQAMVTLGAVARQRSVTRSWKPRFCGLITSPHGLNLDEFAPTEDIHHMMTSSGDEFFGFGAMPRQTSRST